MAAISCYNTRVKYRDAQPLPTAPAASRPDFDVIVHWVTPGASVLDLGCGEGELMARLVRERGVKARGVDLHQPSVSACIARGLSVYHGDLHEGLADLRDNAFDYVILSRTLQQVPDPDQVIRRMLRVGGKAIVSFPNFAYWRIRLHLLLHGTLPVSPALPYAWYNTPNIRLITIADFEQFARALGYVIHDRVALVGPGRVIRRGADLFGEYGMFLLGREKGCAESVA
ncbi:MAG TPA: methionine biosynthesis protein MetW [Armatimonadota bacterium]|nr:methionine biosynthesis protein MetW [Armatimonadota bacterium]